MHAYLLEVKKEWWDSHIMGHMAWINLSCIEIYLLKQNINDSIIYIIWGNQQSERDITEKIGQKM